MSTRSDFDLAYLLSCAVAANAHNNTKVAWSYLEQIPPAQLRRAEELLAGMRSYVTLRRESGVDFDTDDRPLYQFTVRHKDICGHDTASGEGVCVCTPDLVAMAALTPDDPSLPGDSA